MISKNQKAIAAIVALIAVATFFRVPSVVAPESGGQLSIENTTSKTVYFAVYKNGRKRISNVQSVGSGATVTVDHPVKKSGTRMIVFADKASRLNPPIVGNLPSVNVNAKQHSISVGTPCCGPAKAPVVVAR